MVFAFGVLVFLATAFVLYSWIALGTEALLVPWHCECSWDTRPALGTVPRALNDFFATAGRDLASLVFVLVTGAIVATRIWHAERRTWLPLLFSGANVVFLAANMVVITLTWSLSDSVVGRRAGLIDAGYHRTWFGIAATGILWIVYWLVLVRLPVHDRPRAAGRKE